MNCVFDYNVIFCSIVFKGLIQLIQGWTLKRLSLMLESTSCEQDEKEKQADLGKA